MKDRCLLCDKPGEPVCDVCRCELVHTEQTRKLMFVDRLAIMYEYDGILKKRMNEFKFARNTAYAEIFSYLAAESFDFRDIDGLIVVPSDMISMIRRGFNQSRLIADGISKRTGIPVYDILKKPVQRTSHSMRAEVRRSFEHRFKMKSSLPTEVRHVAIIDDIFTTGKTVSDIAKTIKLSGYDITVDAFVMLGDI